MKETIKHSLEVETAKKLTDLALRTYQERFPEYSPKGEWIEENTAQLELSAKGITLKGMITVRAGAIDMEMDVPFIFRPLRKKALSVIQEKIEEWIAKYNAGEVEL